MCESVESVWRARFDTFPIGLVFERFESISKPYLTAGKGESSLGGAVSYEGLMTSYEILGGKSVERQQARMEIGKHCSICDQTVRELPSLRCGGRKRKDSLPSIFDLYFGH